MATRSIVTFIENGTFTSTYIHYDGYPEYLGKTLIDSYNNSKAAKELCEAGYISSLSDDLQESIDDAANNTRPVVSKHFDIDMGQEYEYFWFDTERQWRFKETGDNCTKVLRNFLK